MLRAELVRRLAAFTLEASIEVEPGAPLVLVGENGAGKTTVLRILAGLLPPDRGRIEVNGRVWCDTERGPVLPAARREVGYVAQDYALFPHLSVAENVAFGLRASGERGRGLRSKVGRALERFGLLELAHRRPPELSGGQAQRVALARALVTEPALLLLDEPLAALDLQTRREVRGAVRRLLAELPCLTIYVTHSPMEAMLFGERIAVLEAGRIVQCGARDELLRHPRSPYVAEFLGVNLYSGRIRDRRGGLVELVTEAGSLWVVDPGGDDDVFVAVSPREVTLFREPPAASARNVFRGRIVELAPEPPRGERVRVLLATRPPLVAEVTADAVEALGLREGVEVHAAFKASGVAVYR
ncbi:MAG TPA: ABC transporter ATP-binding protein [Gemmatimonadales bacterium]|nr:ABC transporter ATP-binding protein [Gemmatimonadales bacterium]